MNISPQDHYLTRTEMIGVLERLKEINNKYLDMSSVETLQKFLIEDVEAGKAVSSIPVNIAGVMYSLLMRHKNL